MIFFATGRLDGCAQLDAITREVGGITVNAAPRVLKAPPGLLLMTDIGVPSYA